MPMGSVFIYCPRRKVHLKLAKALVIERDYAKPRLLKDSSSLFPQLEPFAKEIECYEDMYYSIWNFHTFIDESQISKSPIVQELLKRELGFDSDDFLKDYHILDSKRDEYSFSEMSSIIRYIDENLSGALKAAEVGEVDNLVDKAILKSKEDRLKSAEEFRFDE
jgi:hypothetical protein